MLVNNIQSLFGSAELFKTWRSSEMWKSNLCSSTLSFGNCPLEFNILAVWRPAYSFFFSPSQNGHLLFKLLFKLILNFLVMQPAFLPTCTWWVDSGLFLSASETFLWGAMSWLFNILFACETYVLTWNYCKEHLLSVHIFWFEISCLLFDVWSLYLAAQDYWQLALYQSAHRQATVCCFLGFLGAARDERRGLFSSLSQAEVHLV